LLVWYGHILPSSFNCLLLFHDLAFAGFLKLFVGRVQRAKADLGLVRGVRVKARDILVFAEIDGAE